MYRVFLERAAEKQLKQLTAKLYGRVIAAIQALAKNPRPSGCRKLTGSDVVNAFGVSSIYVRELYYVKHID